MTFSIRTRLTLWYVTLLAVSLICFGLVFSYVLLKIFMSRIDREISSVANIMIHTVITPSGQLILPKNFDIILERFFGIRTSGNYIQILAPDGRIVARSSSLKDRNLPVTDSIIEAVERGETVFETVGTVGRYPVRVVSKPVIIDKKPVAIIQVGTTLKGLEEIFHSLGYILLFDIVASVVIASAVGWFLARKALRPVDEITMMARRISAESLNERLDIKGPQDELLRLADTFNEMIARLERSFNQIRQFTADASHELKTPLTVLRGEIEVALRTEGSVEGLRSVLESALEEIERMNYIVRSLLELARVDAEKTSGVGTDARLDRIVMDRIEQIRKFAVEKGIRVDILKIEPVVVKGDPLRFSQLIFNLLDNAVKYTHRDGRVDVSLEERDGYAVFKVKDTGIGISKDDLPYIFDRFYRVDRARTREAGGVGLGLSICREIVDSYGGRIEVESELGKGSVFTVYLPLDEDGRSRINKT